MILSMTLSRRTWLHGIGAGKKLIFLLIFSILIVPLDRIDFLSVACAGVFMLYAAAGWEAVRQFRLLLSLLPILGVILVAYALIETLEAGLIICLRVCALVALANLVTMTTRMDDMLGAVQVLFRPFRRIGVPDRVIGLAVTMTIRFVPHILAHWRGLVEAWRSRSVVRPSWRLIAPLMVAVMINADHVGEALAARGGLIDPDEDN